MRDLSGALLLLGVSLVACAEGLPVNVNCNADLLCIEIYKSARVKLLLDNRSEKPLSFRLFLNGNTGLESQPILHLDHPLRLDLVDFPNTGTPWGFEYRIHYGHQRYTHDDKHVYQLPYAPGSAFEVSQSYTNWTTHHPGNRFALDFSMPIGTPVHAARGGRVVSIYAGSDARSMGGEASANHIWILHSDGTIGKYLHLSHNGVKISQGDEVEEGDEIGVSGNTGFSTGEHLHFSVSTLNEETLYETFNLRFATRSGVVQLISGRRYDHPEAPERRTRP